MYIATNSVAWLLRLSLANGFHATYDLQLTNSVAATSTDVAITLDTINSNIELLILIVVLFECIKFVRYGFNKLYEKGV